MRYFDQYHSVESIKKAYRKLAFQYHPDTANGDLRIMQNINAQYHEALKKCNNQDEINDSNKGYTYEYNQEKEQEIMDKISQLINAGILDTCEIEIIGSWIWITGNTYPVKSQLKECGCIWHSKRKVWYWAQEKKRYTGKYASNLDLDGLANKYGSVKIDHSMKAALA